MICFHRCREQVANAGQGDLIFGQAPQKPVWRLNRLLFWVWID